MMTDQRWRHRQRLLAVLASALVAGLALAACGGSGRASVGPGFPFGPQASGGGDTTGGILPSGSSGPWVAACDLLSDGEVAALVNGYGTTVTVTGHQAKETQNSPSDRISACDYALRGTKGNETLTAGGISITVDEIGALYYFFPLSHGFQRVDGLGDEAAWTTADPPELFVRVGERLYQFNGGAPIITDDADQIDQLRRDVLLKVAKATIAKI
jgi:hypothetical protein